MISTRSLLVSAVMLLILALVNCQLTFSPDWGKRAVGVGGSVGGSPGFFDTQTGNCKSSNEMLLEIFRFIQAEAQQFLDCKHRE